MLRTRILTVLVLLPLLLAALFFASNAWWALLLAPLVLTGAWEWGALAGWQARGRLLYAALTGAAGLCLWLSTPAAAASALGTALLIAAVVFWLALVPLWLARGWRVSATPAMALAGFAVLLPLWLALVQLQQRPWLLLFLMGIVWISDTAAYFCGKRWGRRKLAATISPGKTWEGAAGALMAVAVYYFVLAYLVPGASGVIAHDYLQGITGCMVFLTLAILGIEGDLFESWVKRTAGVKDSGTAFPGHGGLLDRIDALTASMPAAALLLSGAV
ncbi:MAG: phosphatidate cytidylyltransferase [Betaproteobacteria bacterium]|nr:phosphatidate cytidylyltransferase [Betaproteobacteria bacterium]